MFSDPWYRSPDMELLGNTKVIFIDFEMWSKCFLEIEPLTITTNSG